MQQLIGFEDTRLSEDPPPPPAAASGCEGGDGAAGGAGGGRGGGGSSSLNPQVDPKLVSVVKRAIPTLIIFIAESPSDRVRGAAASALSTLANW